MSINKRVIPATDMVGHLMWTRHGVTWATWRLTGMRYSGSMQDKTSVRDLHRLLFRSLQGEALLFSNMLPEDPVTVVERMIKDVDLAEAPDWQAECEATLDELADLQMGERYYWLSVPLANSGRSRYLAPGKAAWRTFLDRLDVPVGRPSREDLQVRVAQAEQIQSLIPGTFHPTPVTVAEQTWIFNHAQRRGLLDLPVPERGNLTEELLDASPAAIAEPILDEGARTNEGAPARANLLKQRVLKVTDPRGADLHDMPASHQALLAVAGTPSGGLEFPGSEIFAALDRTGHDGDWAMPLRINSRSKVLARNRAANRKLNEQFDQRESEMTHGLGAHDLGLAAELLTEYDQLFANDQLEVEVEHTILLAIGAGRRSEEESDADVATLVDQHAVALTKLLNESMGLRLERIPGTAEELWLAMLPGSPRGTLVKHYAQFTTSKNFANLVPLTGSRLGGRAGAAFALNLATARPQIVHINLAGYPELDMSGSLLAVGEMGGGKSVLQKTCGSDLVDQGGQFWAIDKSEDGEWETFVRSFDSHLVVDPMNPSVTMDPLRILPPELAVDALKAFLVQLLRVDTDSARGIVMAQVTEPEYLHKHAITSTSDLVDHLLSHDLSVPEEDRDEARALGQAMRRWARTSVGAVIFEPGLPPADLSVSATAWRTHGMEQPTDAEMSSPHLYRELSLEKKFGRAYYRYLCRLARHLCFADRSRPAALIIDELYDAAQNRENVADFQHFCRRGRRPKALFIAGTHDVGDLRDDVLTGLIPTRVVMRHRDASLASNGVKWLGIRADDPQHDEITKNITEDTSPVLGDAGVPPERRGEGWMRDAFGGIGKVKVLPPARPDRREAVFTTPPKAKVRG
ncbi:MAG: ATP-binding protein [Nocardioidaceae bacterium]|nr:ATP-binding protein [Nocardioidaceae bacterium]